MLFVRCRGKAYCVDSDDGCRTCGRSQREIETARWLVAQASEFVLEMNYDNPSEFTSYLAEKIERKVSYAREQSRLSDAD